MKALRFVVLFMSFLLVAGIALLVYGIMNNWHKKGDMPEVMDQSLEMQNGRLQSNQIGGVVLNSQKLEAFGSVRVDLPDGAQILDTSLEAGVLMIRYQVNSKQQILFYDLSSKIELGKVELD